MDCCFILLQKHIIKTPFPFLKQLEPGKIDICHALLLTTLSPDKKVDILSIVLGDLSLFAQWIKKKLIEGEISDYRKTTVMDYAQNTLLAWEQSGSLNFPLHTDLTKPEILYFPLSFLESQQFEIGRLACCIILSQIPPKHKTLCLESLEYSFKKGYRSWRDCIIAEQGKMNILVAWNADGYLMKIARETLKDRSLWERAEKLPIQSQYDYDKSKADALVEMGLEASSGSRSFHFPVVETVVDETKTNGPAHYAQQLGSPNDFLHLPVKSLNYNHSQEVLTNETRVNIEKLKCEPRRSMRSNHSSSMRESKRIPLPQYNILLLGETGVGKSTFINSLLNYLNIQTLEDAKNAFDVAIQTKFIITDDLMNPISILVNPTRPRFYTQKNNNPEIVKANGESSTQVPILYNLPVGMDGDFYMLNVLDTPGINDTEGMERDLKNSKRIMEELEKLRTIHAICILMKPYKARLTSDVRYILESVLQLHKNTAKNIFFCFTNAKNGPGDTLASLKMYLEKIREKSAIDLQANEENIFWFDNSCFRYICTLNQARKKNFRPERLDVFNSILWTQNVEMAKKLLKKVRSSPGICALPTTNLSKIEPAIYRVVEEMCKISHKNSYNFHQVKDLIILCTTMQKLFSLNSLICLKDPFILKVRKMLQETDRRRTSILNEWLQIYEDAQKREDEIPQEKLRSMLTHLEKNFPQLYRQLKVENLIFSEVY